MKALLIAFLFAACCFAQVQSATPTVDELLASKTVLQGQLAACDPDTSVDRCDSLKVAYSQAVLAWSQALNATLAVNDPKIAEINASLQALAGALAKSTRQPEVPGIVFFFGSSADPNGGVKDVSMDLGGAKLIGGSSYLGVVAHISKAMDSQNRISTKVQLHYAQRLAGFRGASIYWTMEVGPDFVTAQALPVPPSTTGLLGTNIGYAVGSGPLASIPLRKWKFTSLGLHAEVTKGSMQDTGWRGGGLLILGSH